MEGLLPAQLSGGMKKRVALAQAILPSEEEESVDQVTLFLSGSYLQLTWACVCTEFVIMFCLVLVLVSRWWPLCCGGRMLSELCALLRWLRVSLVLGLVLD